MKKIRRAEGEQADALARRFFGRPLGDDPEAADVLRYYLEHHFEYPGGIVPEDVTELELPEVPEVFRIFQQRKFGERPTGNWTRRRRSSVTVKKPKL